MGKARINKVEAEITPEMEKLLIEYHKAYPKEKFFHVTGDRQVFLQREEKEARAHQYSISNNEKVQIISAIK